MKPATIVYHPNYGIGVFESETPDNKLACVFGGETLNVRLVVKRLEIIAIEPEDLTQDQANSAIYLLQSMSYWRNCTT